MKPHTGSVPDDCAPPVLLAFTLDSLSPAELKLELYSVYKRPWVQSRKNKGLLWTAEWRCSYVGRMHVCQAQTPGFDLSTVETEPGSTYISSLHGDRSIQPACVKVPGVGQGGAGRGRGIW